VEEHQDDYHHVRYRHRTGHHHRHLGHLQVDRDVMFAVRSPLHNSPSISTLRETVFSGYLRLPFFTQQNTQRNCVGLLSVHNFQMSCKTAHRIIKPEFPQFDRFFARETRRSRQFVLVILSRT